MEQSQRRQQKKHMDELEGLELILSDTRANVVNNQVCVVTYAGSETKVTGLSDIGNAEADDLEKEAAFDFLTFLTSDTAKEIYEKYYFDINVE
ncbi:MAG: hypothetical protein Q4B75_05570 [Eubacteriales bacterium]|nr:hypothetical protein [Eubacteriales bacterium]